MEDHVHAVAGRPDLASQDSGIARHNMEDHADRSSVTLIGQDPSPLEKPIRKRTPSRNQCGTDPDAAPYLAA